MSARLEAATSGRPTSTVRPAELAGILTLLLDAVKGYAALWIAAKVSGNSPFWMSAAAVAVMLGHIYTPFLRFKGGKGVATFAGAFLFLTPAALAAITLIFLGTVAMTRFISLGSVSRRDHLPARCLACPTSHASGAVRRDCLQRARFLSPS